MRATLTASVLALSLLAAAAGAPAFADRDQHLNVPRDQWLTPAQLSDKLVAQGYKVREIEVDDGAYEVDLVDKNGTRIEAHVHPATGDILVGYDD
ncbi:MAG: PepSY domain-containing protein [Hyphomicrobium sp.]|jgi:hypothetical protein